MKGLLVIVSAPSGAGKTTVVRELVARMRHQYPIQQIVTYTSRALRKGEQEGIDYHTLTAADFEQKIQQGFFLEWSTAYDAYYGTPRSLLDDIARGKINILIIDRAGAQQLMKLVPDAVTVWFTVPSLAVLRERLEMRGRDTQEQIEKRLLLGEKELKNEKEYPFYAYSIENSEKEGTVRALVRIILDNLNGDLGYGSRG